MAWGSRPTSVTLDVGGRPFRQRLSDGVGGGKVLADCAVFFSEFRYRGVKFGLFYSMFFIIEISGISYLLLKTGVFVV